MEKKKIIDELREARTEAINTLENFDMLKAEIDTKVNENLDLLMAQIRMKMLEQVNRNVKRKEQELEMYIVREKPFNSYYGCYSPELDKYLKNEKIVRISFLGYRYNQYLYMEKSRQCNIFSELFNQQKLFFDVKLSELENRLVAEGLGLSILGRNLIIVTAQLPIYKEPPKEVVYVLTRNSSTGKNTINKL